MAALLSTLQWVVGGFSAAILAYLFLLRPKHTRKGPNRGSGKLLVAEKAGTQEDGAGTDVIIVGAGVAGAALAYALGKNGRHVHIIERDLREPDRFVGEVLLPGGYLKLVELGLADCVEDIDAQRLHGYALFNHVKENKVAYSLKNFDFDVIARTFHHGRFIMKLREKAASLPNIRLEQGTVISLIDDDGTIKGVSYKKKTGEEFKAYAPLTIVCDGCFSNLRRVLCSAKVDIPSCCIGLSLKNYKLPYPKYGHIIFAQPSYIVFYPISSTEVRCIIDLPGKTLPFVAKGEMNDYLKTKVAPQLPEELRDPFLAAVDNGDIKTMHNRRMTTSPYLTPGALLIGDAFNMRHPLTAGGMTVALSDIVVLNRLLKPLHNLNDAPALCNYLESFYTLRQPLAFTINTLAGALHKVFSSLTDFATQELLQVCIDYMSFGGVCLTGPVSLLCGLNPQPLSLVTHFLSIMIYGIGRLLFPLPSPKYIWISIRLLMDWSKIILPLIKAEGVRKTFFPATIPAYHRARLVN